MNKIQLIQQQYYVKLVTENTQFYPENKLDQLAASDSESTVPKTTINPD